MTEHDVTQKWTPKLLLEDAVGIFDDEELCNRFQLTLGELQAIRQLKPYATAKIKTQAEITDQGLTFKHKARLQAEMFLDRVMPQWITDPEAPLKDKLAALTKLVEWGELEPRPVAQQNANAGFVFVVNIGGEQQALATTTGRTLEHGP